MLDKKGDMGAQILEFMQKMLHNNHAELTPPIKKETKDDNLQFLVSTTHKNLSRYVWYLTKYISAQFE